MSTLARACLTLAAVVVSGCIQEHRPVGDAADTSTSSDAAGTEACTSTGDTRCSADSRSLEICTDGHWTATSCGNSRVCVVSGGAQCLQTSGEATCRALMYCYLGCLGQPDEARAQCELECYVTGTVAAQAQLVAFQTCADRAQCTHAPTASETLDCLDTSCRTPLAQCYFEASGQDSCASILACYEGCQHDTTCEAKCGQEADLDAQGRYAILELCLFVACADEPNDPTCVDREAGIGGTCASYTRHCLNPL